MDLIKCQQETTPKSIIYCRNLRNIHSMSMWFMEELENEAYYEGKECVSNTVIEMFHSRTDIYSTERFLTEFKKE